MNNALVATLTMYLWQKSTHRGTELEPFFPSPVLQDALEYAVHL
jgi:hypothetical protein